MNTMQQAWAIAVRHFRQYLGDSNLLLQTLFWPLLDACIWGFLGLWIGQMQHSNSDMQLAVMIGIFLAGASTSAAVLIGISLFEELTANNLINIFASPLRLRSWLIGILLFSGMIATSVHVLYITPLIMVMHGGSYMVAFRIFYYLLLFVPPMVLSGIFLGMAAISALISFGKRANELTYVIVWSLLPFTTAYYPLEVLPAWAQTVSKCLPFVHILQAMREYVLDGVNPIMGILKGLLIALLFGAISMYIFRLAFQRSRVQGLARLSD